MLASLLVLVLSAPSIDTIPHGLQLNYRGRFSADRAEPGTAEKNFELSLVVARQDSGAAVCWLLEERGQGSWLWLDRFGRQSLDESGRPAEGVGPSLLYERSEGTSVINVALPFLSYREPLADEVAWLERGLEHRVTGSETKAGVATWRIDVRSSLGRQRTVWVDKTRPVVVAMSEVVFVGQGEQHTLHYELASQMLLGEKSAATLRAFDEWSRLRDRLQIEPRTREIAWSAQRLAQLKAGLPDVVVKSRDTLLARLSQAAEQQAKSERERSSAISALGSSLMGKAAPQPRLEQLAGGKFSWDELAGKVTVLHFWEYRDAPLEEPYGQVAYLDFLCRKHGAGDLRVFGVVADERVVQSETRRAGVQSARRLHMFMNLSYPLLVDGGEATRQFGDPRVTGARLPLFVVIDRTGKIVHYHVGHYEVNRDRGLEELDAIIKKALDNRG